MENKKLTINEKKMRLIVLTEAIKKSQEAKVKKADKEFELFFATMIRRWKKEVEELVTSIIGEDGKELHFSLDVKPEIFILLVDMEIKTMVYKTYALFTESCEDCDEREDKKGE